MSTATAGVCLVVAAVVVAWPERSSRRRQRALGLAGRRPWRESLSRLAGRVGARSFDGRAVPLVVGSLCGTLGLLLGGPVASLVAGAYGVLAAWSVVHRYRRRAATRARMQALDALGGFAAELRSGAPLTPSRLSTVEIMDGAVGRVGIAVSLAAATGAPLADLLDRIEADARAVDRVRAAAAAQRSGMHATAYLLAALPIAGIALGHAIGADPIRVLLHTPLGAACAAGALSLQLAGLAWSARLAGGDRPGSAIPVGGGGSGGVASFGGGGSGGVASFGGGPGSVASVGGGGLGGLARSGPVPEARP